MLNYTLKCLKNERTAKKFPRNEVKSTRHTEQFKVPFARIKNSAIPTMTRILNKNENK